jgi:hypothetical protein
MASLGVAPRTLTTTKPTTITTHEKRRHTAVHEGATQKSVERRCTTYLNNNKTNNKSNIKNMAIVALMTLHYVRWWNETVIKNI